jgi:hypothetical protein
MSSSSEDDLSRSTIRLKLPSRQRSLPSDECQRLVGQTEDRIERTGIHSKLEEPRSSAQIVVDDRNASCVRLGTQRSAPRTLAIKGLQLVEVSKGSSVDSGRDTLGVTRGALAVKRDLGL